MRWRWWWKRKTIKKRGGGAGGKQYKCGGGKKKVEGRVRVHFGSMYGRCGRGWKLIAEK